jgi:uncharacterized protein YuzB (UPF0349 family)
MQWNIDFCKDNLKTVKGAKEASKELKALLEGTDTLFFKQSCINACRPCHKKALILRLNDELITGETNQEIIEKTLKKIKEASCLSE